MRIASRADGTASVMPEAFAAFRASLNDSHVWMPARSYALASASATATAIAHSTM